MVRAHKQHVQIQPGGRIEISSADLPPGAHAEVIVLVEDAVADPEAIIGLFADEPELIDQIVEDAMRARETPLRLSNEAGGS